MVVFDATMLLLLLRPNSGRPRDSAGNPVSQVEERIAHLVQRLERMRTRIIVPTPALSEVLVHAGLLVLRSLRRYPGTPRSRSYRSMPLRP